MTQPTSMQQYFLADSALPDFDQFLPAQLAAVIPVLQAGINDLRAYADTLALLPDPTWDNVVAALAERYETLGQLWGVIGHLHGTHDCPEVREAYNTLLPLMTELSTWLAQHQGLCAAWKKIAASAAFATLSPARQHALHCGLRDFRLSGADLPQAERQRFMVIEQRLAELAAKFSEQVMDETNAFSYHLESLDELKGLPADVLQRARERSEQHQQNGYTLTLQAPDYLAVMEYAENRALREHFYRHYVTRAAEINPQGEARTDRAHDNSPLIDEILALRHEQARLLGFNHYTDLSLASKMAQSSDEVETFLLDLAKRGRPFALQEWQALCSFAQKLNPANTDGKLNAWDIAYYSRLQREANFHYTDEEIKPYFPAPKVIEGLFALCRQLFDINIVATPTPTWDKQVQFFRIINAEGKTCGGFYTDLYARDNKKSGAWMDEVLARGHYRGRFHYPVAYLVANFSPPTADKPALLTMDEVQTLLHEMGHVLHHIMSEVDDLPITGIRGVEWDAVELPSQFMENFAWHVDVLTGFSAHVDTGKPLPRALFDKMVAAKNFHSGLAMMRQMEFSLFDWRIHRQDHPKVLETLAQVRQEVAVIQPPAINRFPHAFSHIFAGGYSAGYYAYKWAEVLSCDGFGLFDSYLQDASQPQPQWALKQVGQRFHDTILAVGGSRPASESFRALRGRDPDVEAMLHMNGLSRVG